MRPRWMPLVPAVLAALSLSSTAIAQRSVDPSSRTWRVEVDGEIAEGDHVVFVPAFFGDGTWGMWVNLEGDRASGWGQYQWNPTAGTIDYINLSDDGGGRQTGQYTWNGRSYVRTRASHPEAPPMALH